MIEIVSAHLALGFLAGGLWAWSRAFRNAMRAEAVCLHNKKICEGLREVMSLAEYGARDEAKQLLEELAKADPP